MLKISHTITYIRSIGDFSILELYESNHKSDNHPNKISVYLSCVYKWNIITVRLHCIDFEDVLARSFQYLVHIILF